MNFVLRLNKGVQYIENVFRYSDSKIFQVVGYTTRKNKAFVFSNKLREAPNMKELHSEHFVEDVNWEAMA